jgi:signal transduction histidine kinase
LSSLRARLGLGLLLSLVLMIGLLWLLTGASVRSLMEEQLASRLAHDGVSLLGGLDISGQGQPALDPQRIQGIYSQPFSGHYFLIEVEGRLIRSRSLWDETLRGVPQVAVGETRLDYITGPQQQPLLLWTSAFAKQGRVVHLAVAEDLVALREGTRRLQVRLLGWSLAVGVLLLIIQQYIVARTLRPIADAAVDVARLEQGEIRELGERVPDEVLPLVHAINQLLQRQRQRLRRSREAIGNLAHAIKTPLTLLQQLARDQCAGRDPQVSEQLERYGRQISGLIDQSLRRARLAGDSLGASRFRLKQDLGVLVETLKRLHQDRAVHFEQRVEGLLSLPLEQQDGMELLGNLLDNAWKWARSRVRLSVRAAVGGGVAIRVEDDGPGVDDAGLQSLVQRGVRRDEAAPGHGLGLSIVKSLVEQLNGRISFSSSPTLGGLRVDLCLGSEPTAGADAAHG